MDRQLTVIPGLCEWCLVFRSWGAPTIVAAGCVADTSAGMDDVSLSELEADGRRARWQIWMVRAASWAATD